MALKLEFRTDTAAFNGDPTMEIGRIFCIVNERIKDGNMDGIIRDVKGNVIGEYEIEGD